MTVADVALPVGHEWADENPFYLAIADDTEGVTIDLGEAGWATTYAAWMRRPGLFVLMDKQRNIPILVVQVHEGDQPYYTARHVGVTGSGGSNEITAYGIGKKTGAGEMVRLWVLPNGMICGGDDVDDLGVRMVKAQGPREVPA
jgi:hypothetical protein